MQLRVLGRRDYVATQEAMRAFTASRTAATEDELWLVEHDPVYTQGIAGRPEHVLDAQGIAVVRSDRGGQVTYHGPGQVLAYPLVDLRRLHIYVKEYVYRIEQAVLKTLESLGITGHRVAGAPGIYVRLDDPFGHAMLTGRSALSSVSEPRGGPLPRPVDRAALSEPSVAHESFQGLGKIAALGVKVSRHCAYHGVALNVKMDLRPFGGINPCGYAGLRTIDLATLGVDTNWNDAGRELARRLANQLDMPCA